MGTAADDYDRQIFAFAEAHRAAMAAGDRELAGDSVEQKILQAVVAKSASDTLSWVKTRVPDGDRRSALLSGLASELQKKDVASRGLAVVEKNLDKQAKTAVRVFIGSATAPAWYASATSIILGIIGFIVHVGNSVGSFLAFLMYLLVFLIGLHIFVPPVRAWVFRNLGGAFSAIGGGARVAGSLVGAFWRSADNVGKPARELYIRYVQSASDNLRGPGYTVGMARNSTAPFRLIANALAAAAIVAFIASVIILIFGVYHGFIQQAQTCQQAYPYSNDCGLSQ